MDEKKSVFKESKIKELITRFKAGDKESFVNLWERVYPYVYHLMKEGMDEDTARDLTSAVCIKLYDRGLVQYKPRPDVSFIAWVHKISLSIKIDAIRRKKPISFSRLEKGGDEIISADHKTAPEILIEREENAVRQQALELLPKLLEILSPEEQYVLYASIYNNLTDKEIARLLTDTERYAPKYKMLRLRALKKLKRLYEKHGIIDFPIKE